MKYRNAKHTENGSIDCEINHPKHGWIPFTASPDDDEKHGRDLFEVITKDGNIAEYEPPVITDEQKWQSIRQQRDQKLSDTQWIMDRHSEQVAHGIQPTLTTTQIKAFAEYRQALRDLPQSVGNPDDVVWPENPLEGK